MTWKPTAGMTARQIEKDLHRQAVMFEKACMNGQIVTAVKFEDFARQWFKEYAELKLKMQPELIELLTRYKSWQDNYIATVGDKWEYTDRLFTTWDGKPMHVTSPADYFKEFCKKNDLRYCSPHSWRHINHMKTSSLTISIKRSIFPAITADVDITYICRLNI